MKRFLFIVTLVLLMMNYALPKSLSLNSISSLSYGVDFDSDFNITGSGSFYIAHQKISLFSALNENFDGKLTLDLVGSDLTNDWYFKEAFGRFKFSDAFHFTMGLQKVEFGLHQFQPTPFPMNSHPHTIRVIPPSDLGISLNGKLADGIFDYDIQLMNGEGLKYWYNRDDVCFTGIANMVLNYAEKGRVGLSYKYAEVEEDFDMAFAVFIYHELDFASVMLEFVGEVTNSDIKDFFSTAIVLNAGDYVDILGRFDAESDAESKVYLGLDIHPFSGVAIKPFIALSIQDQVDFSLYTDLVVTLGYSWSDEGEDE